MANEVGWSTGDAYAKDARDGMGGRRRIVADKPDGEVLLEMRERIAGADRAQSYQRERCDEWREYYNEHWTEEERDDARTHEIETPTGTELTAAQPRITVDKIGGPVEEYMEKYRESGLEVRFAARSRSTPGENVAVMNGLLKRLDMDGGASDVESAAFRDAVVYGYGAMCYRTKYVIEEAGKSTNIDVAGYDQTIVPVRVDRPEWTLLIDPACRMDNKSDAGWFAHRTWYSRDDFQRLWPEAALEDEMWTLPGQSLGAAQRSSTVGIGDPWYRRGNDGTQEVAVVEYYRKVYEPAELRMVNGVPTWRKMSEDDDGDPLSDFEPMRTTAEPDGAGAQQPPGGIMQGGMAPGPPPGPEAARGGARAAPGGGAGPEPPAPPLPERPELGEKVEPRAKIGKKRRLDMFHVEHVTACGDQILERVPFPGDVLPFVVFYGHRMSSEDYGVWHYGLAYLLADLNAAVESVLSDAVGYLARLAKVLFVGKAGFKSADPQAWATLHDVPRNAVEFADTNEYGDGGGGGGDAPQPYQPNLNLGPHLELLRWLNEEIGRASGTLDLPGTQDSSHDRSAQSIIRLNAIGTARNSVFLRNMQSISLRRKGAVLSKMIPAVFDRPGRVEWVKGDKPGDSDRPVFIKAPYIKTKDGSEKVPCPQCGGTGRIGSKLDPACRGSGFAWGADLARIIAQGDFAGKTVHYVDLQRGSLDAETVIGSKEKSNRSDAVNTMQTLLEKGVLEAELVADQLVASLSQDLPELGIVFDRLRQRYVSMHPEEDDSRDAVLARLTEAKGQLEQARQQIEQLQQEADRVKGQKEVAAILAESNLKREMVRSDAKLEEVQAKGETELAKEAEKGRVEMAVKRAEARWKREHEREMKNLEARVKLMIQGMQTGEKQADRAVKTAEADAKAAAAAGGESDG